jgi:hypothetical protein
MRSIFGLNYFVFCITGLILILYCTRDMRDEGFDATGAIMQVEADSVEEFGMSPGVMDQLNSTRAPPTSKCNLRSIFSGWGEPFANTFPQLEYSTSVNKVDRKIDKQIYDNLTMQGMSRMSPESKYTPYHCPKGLME